MIRALYTAATGMEAQQLNMDVIANNLANVNTSGFKRSRVGFQDLLYQNIRTTGSTQAQGMQVPTGIQVGLGTRTAGTQKVLGQGDAQQTGNQFDMMIEGDGFFQVLLPSGDLGFTRDGSFTVDSDGRIVTMDGYTLEPNITVPAEAKEVTIGQDGTVTAKIDGQADPEQLGQIDIVKFVNPAGLQSIGRNIMLATAASGEPTTGTPGTDGLGTIAQGFLEMSNVKVVEEMVNMILAQRAYEVNSKSIQSSDEMLNIANNLRR